MAYAVFGLGGAYAYRAANTADAMWGYRTPEYEYLGKCAARLDDVLNLVPARLSALLIACVSAHPTRAIAIWRRDAHQTASPNAGHPMSAIAGALDVRLEKRGHYVLHPEARMPAPADIRGGRRMVARAMLMSAALAAVLKLTVAKLNRSARHKCITP